MSRQALRYIDQILEKLEDSDGVEPGVNSQSFRSDNFSSDSSLSESENDQKLDEQPQWSRRCNFFLR